MNTRDPFDLRRKNPPTSINLFRLPKRGAFQKVLTKAGERTRSAVTNAASAASSTMTSSYGLPTGRPAGTLAGENIWQPAAGNTPTNRSRQSNTSYSNGQTGGGIGERIGDMLGTSKRKSSLPYYKDKPFNSGRSPLDALRLPRWMLQRRTVALVLGSLALLSWWFGILSPLGFATRRSRGGAIPTSKTPTKAKAGSSWFSSGEKIDWEQRAGIVRDTFKLSFAGYEKYGWGYDTYRPQSHTVDNMSPSGMGWIIVDSLDTMMIMNLSTELTHAREWVHNNLTYDQDQDVNTFETTIRMLGGLLSAHYLSSAFPGKFAPVDDGLSDDMYVEKAADLADRLLSAYETRTGIPVASVNLHKYQGIASHMDGGASSTAEATTLQLEMKYLSKLTGEVNYWEKAEKVMKVVDDMEAPDGLVPIFISADLGTFRGNNIRLGSRGDSYYEYLIKQYLQTSNQEPVYQAMWNESLAGIKKNLITYSEPDNYTVLAERPNGLDNAISAKMDHLVCFMPGTIALATTGGSTLDQARKTSTWGAQQEEDMLLAIELMKTCFGMYAITPTGLAGEITHFNLHEPPLMYNNFTTPTSRPKAPIDFAPHSENENFMIHGGDVHNLQRPETVESLFYLWRITRDPLYRHWGWKIFQSFIAHTATKDGEGFSSVANVLLVPPPSRDDMESFWLAETLKYFYLLFKDDDDLLPLDKVVFNTEAHPFPRFELGKLFKTGWKRKAERSESELAEETRKREEMLGPLAGQQVVTVVHTQLIQRIVEAMATGTATAATATEVAGAAETTPPAVAPVAVQGGVGGGV